MKILLAHYGRTKRVARVQVDDHDYPQVCGFAWSVGQDGEATTTDVDGNVSLPRWVLNLGRGYAVLHQDGDKSNCQRANLIVLRLEDPRYWAYINNAGVHGRKLAMDRLREVL